MGAFSARRKWSVLIAWVVILFVAVGAAAALMQPTDSDIQIDGLRSISTLNKIDADFAAAKAGGGKIVFAAPKGSQLTAADAATVATLTSGLAAAPGVTGAVDPFTATTTAAKTLSPDGRIGYIPVGLKSATASASTQKAIQKAMDAASGSHLQVAASDGLTATTTKSTNVAVGIVIAFVVLAITFGSLLAAGLPLITALIGLGVGIGGIYASTGFITLNSTAPVLAVLLALAVGIDYSVFIVNRHRRQLLEGMGVLESIRLAVGTAGSAVFFAAITVVIALAGLSVVGIGFLTQMGVSAAAAVIVAMLIAVTLTPALLSIFGTRILSKRARARVVSHATRPSRQPARRWVELIARRPVAFTVAALAVLAVLAIPVTGMRLGLPTDGSDPSSSSDRQAYDLLAEGFGAGINGPILVLADYPDADGAASGIQPFAAKLAGLADVSRAVPSGISGREVLVTVVPKSDPTAESTATLVNALRDESATKGLATRPSLLVSGQTAVAIDVSSRLAAALPLYLILVAVFAFLILLVAFRSVLVPLKATLGFLLSLGATLGCVVAVFQWGWLGTVFGVDPAGPLLAFLPIIVVGVLFGLSMDYEMFLVSGMRERHAHGDAPTLAVTRGFAQSAKVVAAAALIMIGIFGNGAINGSGTIKPIAFALAAGVLIDAFVVRMTLVPAVMVLLGRNAWWMPRWLGRIIPKVDMEGTTLAVGTSPRIPAEASAEAEKEIATAGRR
jgi:RND superfamily putative drug exporter